MIYKRKHFKQKKRVLSFPAFVELLCGISQFCGIAIPVFPFYLALTRISPSSKFLTGVTVMSWEISGGRGSEGKAPLILCPTSRRSCGTMEVMARSGTNIMMDKDKERYKRQIS